MLNTEAQTRTRMHDYRAAKLEAELRLAELVTRLDRLILGQRQVDALRLIALIEEYRGPALVSDEDAAA